MRASKYDNCWAANATSQIVGNKLNFNMVVKINTEQVLFCAKFNLLMFKYRFISIVENFKSHLPKTDILDCYI